MKEFKVNPLNVIGSRRVECLLPHMDPIFISSGSIFYSPKHEVLKWIDTNLKGRYWFGNTTKLQDNRIVAYEAVAFEDSHEAKANIILHGGHG